MIAASDMRAMRRTLEALDPAGIASKPAEFRHVFAPSEATVRLALELVQMGGRGFLPGPDPNCAACELRTCEQHPPHAWIALIGWAVEGHMRPGAEMRVTSKLVEEFNRQREARGR